MKCRRLEELLELLANIGVKLTSLIFAAAFS
ncbi:hypothetical protein NDCJBJIB_03107 [Mannheimia haemolytica]